MSSDVKITISAIDKTKSAFDGIGGAIGKMGKIAAGVAIGGIAALAAGLAFSVKAAMEAEEIQAQLEAVLKSTGGAAGMTADAINDMAMELSQVTRFEDDAIVAGQNILLTFTKIGKDVFPEATEVMLDMSTALGQDLQSSAIQLGKALNDPVQGITALQRVGVSFTDEQKKMVQAMVDAGDVMGAQKFILQELQTEFGGSAKAAGETFAGQLDILKNNLGNVAENIGMKVLPLLTPFVEKINGLASAFFEAGLDSVEFQDELANLFGEEMAQGIHNVIVWLGENIPVAIKAMSDIWSGVLYPALQTVWAFIQTSLIPVFVTAYTWLQANLPAAIAKLTGFWNNTLKPALNAIWAFIQNNVVPIFETLASKLNAEMPGAITTLVDFWNNTLKPALEAVWKFLSVDMLPIWQALDELIGVTVALAFQALALAWEAVLKPAFDAIWKLIQDYVLPAFDSIANNTTLQAWIAAISSAISWLIDKLKIAVDWFKQLRGAEGEVGVQSTTLNSMALGNTLMGNGIGPWSPPVGIPPGNLKWPTKFLRDATRKRMMRDDYPGRTGVDMTDNQELKDMLKRMMSFFEGGVNQYNLTINEAGQRGNIIMDFALLQALARG